MSSSATRFEPNAFKVKSYSPHDYGGFGEVWDAWHDRFERVAIKILRQRVNHE